MGNRRIASKEHMRLTTWEFAESRAKRPIPMTMEDWAIGIETYLSSDERPLLDNAGSNTKKSRNNIVVSFVMKSAKRKPSL